MARRQLIGLFSVTCVLVTKSSPNQARLCLLGWTGDGKTEFCNRYDGTVCPRESGESEEESRTTNVYFGQSMLDTPGFGENRQMMQDQSSLQASLEAIKKTLLAINQTRIRAIAWMVPCTERSTKKEAFDLMNLFKDMVGKRVPIVAVFNPGSPQNSCVKDTVAFKRLAGKHGIDIREVFYFDDFSLSQFEQKYNEAFRVMVPDNLQNIIQKKDPHFLASQLKRIRELRCQTLPKEIESIRKTISETRASIKEESTIALCQRGDCNHVTLPTFRDCTTTVCTEKSESCSGWGPFEDCDIYCSRSQVVDDQGCLQRNAAAAARYDELLTQCSTKVNTEHDACLQAREGAVLALQKKNTDISQSIGILVQQEKDIVANMRTCDNMSGTSGTSTEL